MLTCAEARERLDDHVDELLDAASSRELEAHLEGCAGCRAELRELRRLLAEAAALPDEIEPPRELWDGIASRLEPRGRVLPFAPSLRRWAFLAPPLAAAAALALAIGLGLRSGPATAPFPAPGPGQSPVATTPSLQAASLGGAASLEQAEAEYRRATEQLLESLRSDPRALPPGTLEAVEKNLSDIDRALGEIRAALGKDPENAQLARLLNGTQRRKLQMLQSVARLTRT